MELLLFHFKLYLIKGILSGNCKFLVTFSVEDNSISEFRIRIHTYSNEIIFFEQAKREAFRANISVTFLLSKALKLI